MDLPLASDLSDDDVVVVVDGVVVVSDVFGGGGGGEVVVFVVVLFVDVDTESSKFELVLGTGLVYEVVLYVFFDVDISLRVAVDVVGGDDVVVDIQLVKGFFVEEDLLAVQCDVVFMVLADQGDVVLTVLGEDGTGRVEVVMKLLLVVRP